MTAAAAAPTAAAAAAVPAPLVGHFGRLASQLKWPLFRQTNAEARAAATGEPASSRLAVGRFASGDRASGSIARAESSLATGQNWSTTEPSSLAYKCLQAEAGEAVFLWAQVYTVALKSPANLDSSTLGDSGLRCAGERKLSTLCKLNPLSGLLGGGVGAKVAPSRNWIGERLFLRASQ